MEKTFWKRKVANKPDNRAVADLARGASPWHTLRKEKKMTYRGRLMPDQGRENLKEKDVN